MPGGPGEILGRLLKVNPFVGNLILGGLGVIAAATLVLQWKVDREAAIAWASVILAVGIGLMILSRIFADKDFAAQARVIAWVFVASLICWVGLWFGAVVGLLPNVDRDCLNPFVVCNKRLAVSGVSSGPRQLPQAFGLILSAEASERVSVRSLQLAQAAPQASPQSRYIVYLQFAGFVRSDVELLSTSLKALGWRIPGEERSGAANRLNVVRYRSAADQSAAQTLADDINRFPALRNKVRLELNSLIANGTLEIWISP
jgi:hypothetical protein